MGYGVDLGRQFNVKERIIQGGKRTTDKYKGQVSSPITIKVYYGYGKNNIRKLEGGP